MIASCSAEKTPEMDEVLNLLERIYEDGVVMPDEHDELMVMLKNNFQLCKNHCAAGVLRAGRARCQGAVLRVHQEDLQGAETAASLRCGFEDAMEGIRQWQDRDAKKRELRDKSWKE